MRVLDRIRILTLALLASACPPPATDPRLSVAAQKQLFDAIEAGDVATLQTLLDKRPPLDFVDDNADAPLHASLIPCKPAVVAVLAAHGADVNARGTRVGLTPLNVAIAAGARECIDALLKAGADVNRADSSDITPVGFAVTKDDMPLVALLVKAGADLSRKQGGVAVAELTRSAPMKTFLATCARSAAACDPAAVVTDATATPAPGWWTAGDTSCPPKAKLERKGDVVRCACGGGSHGPYTELYRGTEQPLASGTYSFHKKTGVWTTYGKTGAIAKQETFVDDILAKTEIVDAKEDVPPAFPGDFLSSAELARMRTECTP